MTTFTVNTLVDENDGIDVGKISLREAIASANAAEGADKIVFEDSLTGGSIKLTQGELFINDDLTITGQVKVDGQGKSSVFQVGDWDNFVKVVIEELTVTGGDNDEVRVYSDGFSYWFSEAGIVNFGDLTLNQTKISGNKGEGIYNRRNLTLNQTEISGNKGEGIKSANTFGTKLTVNDSQVLGNYGYGISTLFVNLNVKNSIVSDNKKGGINCGFAYDFKIANSTISNNSKNGIDLSISDGTLINSTISGNKHFGIYHSTGYTEPNKIKIQNSTITLNQKGGVVNHIMRDFPHLAGTVEVSNSIISGNQGYDVNNETVVYKIDGYSYENSGEIISNGGNLIGTTNVPDDFQATKDRTGITNPGLKPLADNGGLTLTHALKANSLVINAGLNQQIPLGIISDQRGYQRIINKTVDIGAFEFGAYTFPTISITDVKMREGNKGQKTANFIVSLSDPTILPVTVKYATVNQSAKANGDFWAKTGTVSFKPGVTRQIISVKVKGDTLVEAEEAFLVRLSNPSKAIIEDNLGVATIINDDLTRPASLSKVIDNEMKVSNNFEAKANSLMSHLGQDIGIYSQTTDSNPLVNPIAGLTDLTFTNVDAGLG